jgi:phosphatidylglycerol---prolipoprotein diacylglyceryl transferase
MLDINLDPTLIQIGPLLITWHGFFTAVGVLAGIWLAVKYGARVGFSEDDIMSVALWGVIGGILGARLFHVIDQWGYYSQNPLAIIRINEGGLAIFGTVVGGPLAGAIYARRRGFSVSTLLDVGAIGLLMGMAIGRVGDIINGEHHGTQASGPLSVSYTHPNTLGEPGLPVHLAVGYELVLDLVVFAVLVAAFSRMPRPGMVFWLFAALYSFERFFIQFFRVDSPFVANISQAQASSLVVGAAALFILVNLYSRARRDALAAEEAELAAYDDEELEPDPALSGRSSDPTG